MDYIGFYRGTYLVLNGINESTQTKIKNILQKFKKRGINTKKWT